MKKVAISVAIILFALAVGLPVRHAEAAPKTLLLMAGSSAPSTSISMAVVRFVKRVQQDSNGEVMISFRSGGELYADKDLPTAIVQDAIDLALTNFGTWSGIFPSLTALELAGGIYDGPQHLYRAQDGALGKILKADLAAKGITILGWADTGPTNVLVCTKKLVKHPADLKGLLIRAPNTTVRWLMEGYGATPTFASASELYTALERGTVDGAFSAMENVTLQRFYEGAPYITQVMTSVCAPNGVVASKRGWGKLTPAQQELLLKDWAIEMDWDRKEAARRSAESWDTLTKNPKLKTYKVTAEEQKKDWDPIAREYQLKKLIELVGKEKADQLLKAIAVSR